MKQSTSTRCATASGWSSTAPAPARRARIVGYDVAGKTGTAQVISNQGKAARRQDRPRPARPRLVRVLRAGEEPEIAGVVFAEHAEHGSSAAPIAKYMMETCFAKKEGRPLPTYPGSRARTRCRRPPSDAVIASRCPCPASRAPSRRPSTPASPPGRPAAAATEGRRMFDERRLQHHIDWPLLAAVLALAVHRAGDDLQRDVGPAAGRPGVGPRVLDAALRRRHRRRRARSSASSSTTGGSASTRWSSTCGVAALLLYVLFFGVVAGRRAALDFPWRLQPAAVRVREGRARAGAGHVLRRGQPRRRARRPGRRRRHRRRRLPPDRAQPDLGSAVTLLPILVGIAYVGRPAHAAARRSLALVAVCHRPGRWVYGLKDYQKERVVTFLDPAAGRPRRGLPADPGAHHGRIGRPDGQGLPQRHAGPVQVPARRPQRLRLLRARRGARVPRRARHAGAVPVRAAPLAGGGAARHGIGTGPTWWSGLISCFAFQVMYNIAMSAGLAPVKGLTLPLMSYGGSSMIATLMSFGLILNVRMRRFAN